MTRLIRASVLAAPGRTNRGQSQIISTTKIHRPHRSFTELTGHTLCVSIPSYPTSSQRRLLPPAASHPTSAFLENSLSSGTYGRPHSACVLRTASSAYYYAAPLSFRQHVVCSERGMSIHCGHCRPCRRSRGNWGWGASRGGTRCR